MVTYTIGDAASRSGFSASALRYYEGIGLVAPASRTDAGYRVYDDDTLARLVFIARAKRLGCTLEEITDLVAIWDGDRCEPVQRRFHDVVNAKIVDAQAQIDELVAFVAELQDAAARLGGPAIDGPCNEGCACLAGPVTDTSAPAAVPVRLSAKPADPPIACTLDGGEMANRLAQWRALPEHGGRPTRGDDGALRIELDDTSLAELARLVAAEQECCAFFAFTITVDRRGIGLQVRAPDEAGPLVTSLFGEPE